MQLFLMEKCIGKNSLPDHVLLLQVILLDWVLLYCTEVCCNTSTDLERVSNGKVMIYRIVVLLFYCVVVLTTVI